MNNKIASIGNPSANVKPLDQLKELAAKRMKEHDIGEVVINFFNSLLEKVYRGETGELSAKHNQIGVLDQGQVLLYESPRVSTEGHGKLGLHLIDRTVIIKLNGGLGTSMGLKKAKSLLPVKGTDTFLDIIVRQFEGLKKRYNSPKLQLIFMNSDNTSNDTNQFLRTKYPALVASQDKMEIMQNKFPKINQKTLEPANHNNDVLNWNPPGHGDIYSVLYANGVLEGLIEKGYKYAFVSNSDNLAATLDPVMLGFMEHHNVPFVMETAERTEADKKGGFLAKDLHKKDSIKLVEKAMWPADEEDDYGDFHKWTDFNTNTSWINLEVLFETMKKNNGTVPLDIIKNKKVNNETVDSAQASPMDLVPVFQLETAMGSAINNFEGAKAVRVDAHLRFFPVKTSGDLFALRSDAFIVEDDGSFSLNDRDEKPVVLLDTKKYKTVQDLHRLAPNGIPSMQALKKMYIQGDVVFGQGVKLSGVISIINKSGKPYFINDGSELKNTALIIGSGELRIDVINSVANAGDRKVAMTRDILALDEKDLSLFESLINEKDPEKLKLIMSILSPE